MSMSIQTISDELPENNSVYSQPKKYAVANCQLLNLRNAAALDAYVMRELEVGTELVVDEIAKFGWAHVTLTVDNKELTGYVMSDFIKNI